VGRGDLIGRWLGRSGSGIQLVFGRIRGGGQLLFVENTQVLGFLRGCGLFGMLLFG